MKLHWQRSLRTPNSERFLASCGGREAAVIDLHYLADGTVAGTVVLLEGGGLGPEQIPEFLQKLDDELLPGVDLGSGNLQFSVVIGTFLGNFQAEGAGGDDAET
jgi:hypothetical protein